jgi:Na+/H+ antiporter NhaD/arsenite permease-like protein
MEAAVAVLGAALLVALGALSPSQAWDALGDPAPTAAFLAALLVLAEALQARGAVRARAGRGGRGGEGAVLAILVGVNVGPNLTYTGSRAEDEVLDAAREADVLVLARGGEPDHLGPKSVGHAERFVLDHASCAVLLVRC